MVGGAQICSNICISKQSRTQLLITRIKLKKNATSHTMGPILPSTSTQHRDSMRKITRTHARTHTHTHTHTHAYIAISDESNRSILAHI